KEAMYIAAYFGSQRQVSLKILTSSVGIEDPSKSQNEAKAYLSLYPIKAEYIITDSTIPQEIEQLIQHDQIDLILIGGYRGASIIDFVLGSVVDQVLREIQIPILICR
ncbi:MAG: universal stress protein, partial [Anaerolineales bacterium]|nr:universal stress protein [Anaerolineales bacterium]